MKSVYNLESLLKEILQHVKKELNLSKNNLKIWLFLYNSFGDIIEHWEIFPKNNISQFEELFKDTKIRYKTGTIGYVVTTKQPHYTNDTFDDPRGTVAIQDLILKNYSWLGIPIKKKQADEVEVIISFCCTEKNFWNKKKKEDVLRIVKLFEQNILLQKEKKDFDDKINFLISTFSLDKQIKVNENFDTYKKILIEKWMMKIHKFFSNLFFIPYLFLRVNNNKDIILSIDINLMINAVMENLLCETAFVPNTAKKLKNSKIAELFEKIKNYLKKNETKLDNFLILTYWKKKDLQDNLNKFKGFLCSIIKLVKLINETLNFKQNKEVIEIAKLIFNTIFSCFYNHEESISNKLEWIIKWINARLSNDNQINNIIKIKNIIRELESKYKDIFNLRNSLVIIEVFLEEEPGICLNISDNIKLSDEDLKNLRHPSTIFVLLRFFGEKSENKICLLENYPALFFQNWDYEISECENKIKLILKKKGNRNNRFVVCCTLKPKKNFFVFIGFNEDIFSKILNEEIKKSLDSCCATKLNKYLSEIFYISDINLFHVELERGKEVIIGIPLKKIDEEKKSLSKNYIQKTYYLVKNEINKITVLYFALRSAIAAIMSRNMSHNIGSHVLAYLRMEKLFELAVKFVNKDDGESVNKIKGLINKIEQYGHTVQSFCNKLRNANTNGVKKELNTIKKQMHSHKEEIQNIINSLTGSELRWGLMEWIEDTKIFFEYLQHRMDFLAQISTEWPEWSFSAYLMKDIMRYFLSQRHLLDGIAKSEGLRGFYYDWEKPYKQYLEVKQKSDQGKSEEYGRIKFHVVNLACFDAGNDEAENKVKNIWYENVDNNKINEKCRIKKRLEQIKAKFSNEEKKKKRILLYTKEDSEVNIEEGDIQIAIPGGIIGYHAFYVILENIIRNSAKHSYTKMKDLLKEWAELQLLNKNCINNDKEKPNINKKEEILKKTFGEQFDEAQDLEVIVELTDRTKGKRVVVSKEDSEAKEKAVEAYLFRIYDNVSLANRGSGTITISSDASSKDRIRYSIEWERENDKLTYTVYKIEQNKNGKETKKEICCNGDLCIKGSKGISILNKCEIDENIKCEIKTKLNRLLKTLKEMLYDRSNKIKKFRIFPESIDKDWKTPEFDIVAYMNECLHHSIIIKETGELDKKHWGMAEMKIAAGYLQGRDISRIGAEGNNITGSEDNQDADEDFIIRAVESPVGTLGFEFKVRKPKEVGIVCYKKEKRLEDV